ncbi:hypothetical protein [Croceicoccus sp. BE223]|uniref:hypothetical protein n=1 Tax=Croceicoccus sp. BE223 TaxID=2817716 RepID=UPI00285AE84A|nr:hypothetical protein [Croceicoccus sp. BE223]MDR7102522.1 putative secreted protein with C-terminal beta-propeller domain [Croceicoccus sp. BE223]
MTFKNAILLAAATVTVGTMPAIATAQTAKPAAAKPAAAAVATDPDLRCATWAMVAGAQEKDAVKKERMGIMMSYFMGRYEARTGGKIETQINRKSVPVLLGNIDDTNKTCIAAARGFGMRLGTTLKGMQPPQAAGTPAAATAKPAAAPKGNAQATGGR